MTSHVQESRDPGFEKRPVLPQPLALSTCEMTSFLDLFKTTLRAMIAAPTCPAAISHCLPREVVSYFQARVFRRRTAGPLKTMRFLGYSHFETHQRQPVIAHRIYLP